MPWISKKKLDDLEFRLDKLEEFKSVVDKELYDGKWYHESCKPSIYIEGKIKQIEDIKSGLAYLLVRYLDPADGSIDSLPSLVPDIRRFEKKLKDRKRDEAAALYESLPDECKNGHKKGGKR